MTITFTPIGVFRCRETWPYDAARQGALAAANEGEVQLRCGCNYEQALRDLAGFSHVWLVFTFHRNRAWKPLVRPPRGSRKVGVFASRAPYRPNPIGLTCVELAAVDGLTLRVRGHDLLDGTPILDIKPYIPYADAVPNARTGWLAAAERDDPLWDVAFSPEAEAQVQWLEAHGAGCLSAFFRQQLGTAPLDATRKRLRRRADGTWEIAYRTWRAEFTTDPEGRRVCVLRLRSGYSRTALASVADRYGDKAVHRAFLSVWPGAPAV